MPERTVALDGAVVPRFLYGTAWKEDATASLTQQAVINGFRGIDTANQRRHYHEAAVGEAVAALIAAESIRREDLYLQTKFTFVQGQDHRLPYDPTGPVDQQVQQSFASSLQHLGVTWLDGYLLHGPIRSQGLTDVDWQAWQAIESLYGSGQAKMIGVSNFNVQQLRLLLEATVKPMIVQNRCFAVHAWDREVRLLCREHGVLYQGFSLLTANQQVLSHPALAAIAQRHGRTAPQIIFRFALEAGITPLTGTMDAGHMQQDLAAFDFQLDAAEVEQIESIVAA